jgi:pilus assembly protein Flp/PilA
MRKFIQKLAKSKAGVTAIEYGLIAALIAVVCIAGLTAVGTSLNNKYNTISTSVTAAGG